MIEIAAQLQNGIWRPYSPADLELSKNYKENQICRAKITGVQKPRSVEQLALYWVCCNMVAANTENEHFDTPEKVDHQLKIALQYIKGHIVIGNSIHVMTGSISFKNLGHLGACNYFDRAFPLMAKWMGISVDELTNNGNRYYR